MKKITLAISLIVAYCTTVCYSQNSTINIVRTQEDIVVDGALTENTWKNAEVVTDFFMTYPSDSIPAKTNTEVRTAYNDKFLYIAALCYDENDGDYIVQSLKRDYSFLVNDGFAVVIDAFTDGTSGLSFAVSPFGVQREGIVARGGAFGVSTSWDGMWFSEVSRGGGYWSVEMAIPFKTLRFDPEQDEWAINFVRNDLKENEVSAWRPIPRGFNVASLAHTGTMKWDEKPKNRGGKVTLIPYVASSLSRDYTNISQTKVQYSPNAGLDAKFDITSSLNLDLTVNPDFSQVEVDEQVINLDRFELNFPERRLYFQENSDLFAGLGNSRVRPFFSRRIGGVGSDPVPVYGGLKLSGKIGRDWRVGVLDVQTGGLDSLVFAQNWFIATAQRKVLRSSAIRGFITNRQGFFDKRWNKNDYNRVGGLEFDFRSKNGEYTGHTYAHYSTSNEKLRNQAYALGFKGRYKSSNWSWFVGLDAVGKNYITDMGFVPRLYHSDDDGNDVRIGYNQIRSNGYYNFFLKQSDKIDYISPYLKLDIFLGDKVDYQEHRIRTGIDLVMMNTGVFEVEYINQNPILFYNFTLSGLDQAFAPGNYRENIGSVSYQSNRRQKFSFYTEFIYGQKYLGKIADIEAEFNYRHQPWGVFGLTLSQKNLFDFPEEYGSASFYLIGPKVEISFNRNLFLTTFIQYNTQRENFNINSRFQWRFRPMSDLFIVFTNNYASDTFTTNDWAIVLKANYRFDL